MKAGRRIPVKSEFRNGDIWLFIRKNWPRGKPKSTPTKGRKSDGRSTSWLKAGAKKHLPAAPTRKRPPRPRYPLWLPSIMGLHFGWRKAKFLPNAGAADPRGLLK